MIIGFRARQYFDVVHMFGKLSVCTREHQIQTYVEHVSAYCIGFALFACTREHQQFLSCTYICIDRRGDSRATDGTETECTGTTPWARACRFPAQRLPVALQQGTGEPAWLTPDPLSKGPAGSAPAPPACPWARTLVLCPLPPCTLQQGARVTISLTPGPLSKGLVGVAPAPLVCPWARPLVLAPHAWHL